MKARLAATDEVLESAWAKLNHSQRRALVRKQRSIKRRTVYGPFAEADIPAGSVLSDATLEAIRAGEYRLAWEVRAAGSRPSRKQRQAESRAAKQDNLRRAMADRED